VTLRGAVDANGAPATIINWTTDSDITFGDTSWGVDTPAQYTTVNVTSGATRGSTTLVLSDASALVANQIFWISSPSNATIPPETTWTPFLTTDPFSQAVKCVSKAGNTVTITPAVNADYLTTGIRASWRATSFYCTKAGLENVSVMCKNGTTGTSTIYFKMNGAVECWMKNVKSYWAIGGGVHHMWINESYRCEIRDCDMNHVAPVSLASNAYCILLIHSSNWLIENNYFHDIPNVMPIMGGNGGVFSYNYVTNLPYWDSNGNPSSWLSQIVFFHGSHNHYNLFEGNWFAATYCDATSRNNVFLRNRMRAYDPTNSYTASQPNRSQNTQCFSSTDPAGGPGHDANLVIVGNVLGEDGLQTVYSGGVQGSTAIYALGTSAGTATRLWNYNTVNDAIPASEALPGGTAIVTSYLYSSAPSWWGSLPWPWCDPTNFTQSNTATNFPAGYRAINGIWP
jgi:hypothetical protein